MTGIEGAFHRKHSVPHEDHGLDSVAAKVRHAAECYRVKSFDCEFAASPRLGPLSFGSVRPTRNRRMTRSSEPTAVEG